MTETRYPALRRYVTETPWALEASQMLLLREVLGRRLEGDRLTAEEIAEITAAAPRRAAAKPAQGSVAVLPLWGMVAPHQISDLSSGPTTALDSWGAAFDALVDDPSIGTIVLDINSPGGSVDLVPEIAAKVRAANARKEIVAVANTRAGSAAYWIAAQAGQLIVPPSGAVGSVGVYATHEDISRQLAEDGVTVTLVSAGEHKTDGNPFEPLSDEARATIQANVDAYYGMFVADVAAGRRVEPSVVEKRYGQGTMVRAADAVKAGMADGIGTLEEVLDRLLSGKSATGRRGARALELAPAAAAALGVSFGEVARLTLASAAAQELAADILPSAAAAATPPQPTIHVPDDSGTSGAGRAAIGGPTPRKEHTMDHASMQELADRRAEIDARISELHTAAADRAFNEAEQAEFDEIKAELSAIGDKIAATEANIEERRTLLEAAASRPATRIPAVPIHKPAAKAPGSNVDTRRNLPDDLHALDDYRGFAGSVDELAELQKEGARHIVEGLRLVGAPSLEKSQEMLETVLEADTRQAQLAKRIILCGDPDYEKAFGKAVTRGRDSLSLDEDRLMRAAVTEAGIGSETPVPITIDPTVSLTTNGATNPIRALAREVQIAGLTWRGLTSGGMTMAYESAETNQVADQTPTFGGADTNVLRVDGWVAFSIEVDQDWGALRGELAREFADAKDVLEAAKFLTGSGTNEPTGIITALTAATASVVKTAATATFAIDDPDLASNALPPRFDPEASWIAHKTVWAKIEALSRAQGNADPFSFAAEGLPQVPDGHLARVFRGYPMSNASGMDSTFASGKNIMVLGDFGRGMIIIDRIGMNVELVPLVMGANNRPVGQRGLYTYFRNNTQVKLTNAFRLLQVL